jgi:hypothetical protein
MRGALTNQLARTAYALHLYTGQRRADVARMAWSDVAGNAINVVQAKTGARPAWSAQGSRTPRLAEAGCTEKEIAALTGHTTLKEVARYTRDRRPSAACCRSGCQAHGTKSRTKSPNRSPKPTQR